MLKYVFIKSGSIALLRLGAFKSAIYEGIEVESFENKKSAQNCQSNYQNQWVVFAFNFP